MTREEELHELNTSKKDFSKDNSGLDTTSITVFLREEAARAQPRADDQSIEEMFDMMQDGLFYELGIILPSVQIEIDERLEDNHFRIQLNDDKSLPIPGLKPDQFLVNDIPDRLTLLNITKARETLNPASGIVNAIVHDEDGTFETICQSAGLTTWGPTGFIVLSLAGTIGRNASALLTPELVEFNMSLLREAFPALVNAIEAKQFFDNDTLTEVLRDLLDEDISIRGLRSILESLLAINGTTDVDLSKNIVFSLSTNFLCPVAKAKRLADLDIVDYSNCVRMSLKRYISHKYTRGGNTLVVYLMDPKIEERIRDFDKPLVDEDREKLLNAVSSEVGNLPPTAQNPVILTTLEVRKALRNLIKERFPLVAVLSYQELSPDMDIQPIARITWD